MISKSIIWKKINELKVTCSITLMKKICQNINCKFVMSLCWHKGNYRKIIWETLQTRTIEECIQKLLWLTLIILTILIKHLILKDRWKSFHKRQKLTSKNLNQEVTKYKTVSILILAHLTKLKRPKLQQMAIIKH